MLWVKGRATIRLVIAIENWRLCQLSEIFVVSWSESTISNALLLKYENKTQWKNFDDTFSRFGTIPECHGPTGGRHTDRLTDLQYEFSLFYLFYRFTLLVRSNCFAVSNNAINWFTSYLTGHIQHFTFAAHQASQWTAASHTQGSVLGPLD